MVHSGNIYRWAPELTGSLGEPMAAAAPDAVCKLPSGLAKWRRPNLEIQLPVNIKMCCLFCTARATHTVAPLSIPLLM